MPDAGLPREQRDQPAVLVPEEMLDQAGCGQLLPISRISMLAPGMRMPFATSTASS
jgi:hypothetical protein